jgi:hypothetical protein
MTKYSPFGPFNRPLRLMGEPIFLITLFGISLFGLAMMYLQTGFKRISKEQMALHGYQMMNGLDTRAERVVGEVNAEFLDPELAVDQAQDLINITRDELPKTRACE